MIPVVLLSAILVAVIAILVCRKGWLDGQSLVVLIALLVPVLLLARYDINYAVWIAGRPYWMILGVQLAVIAIAGLLYLSGRRNTDGGAVLPVCRSALVLVGILLAIPAGKHLIWPSAGLEPFDAGALAQSVALFLLPLLAGLFLLLNAQVDDERLERLLGVVAAVTALVAVANIGVSLFRPVFEALTETRKMQHAGRSFTPLGGAIPNSLVMYFGYVLCLSRALARREHRSVYLAVCAIAVLGIIVTLTRTTMAVLVVTTFWQLVRTRYRVAAVAWTVLTIAVAAVVLQYAPPSLELSRLTVTKDGSTEMRWQSLTAAIELGRRQPIWGHGFGQVYDQFFYRCGYWTPVMQVIRGTWSARGPHNAYLLLWVEGGVLAVVGFAVMLWTVFWRLRPPVHAKPMQRELLNGFRVMVAGIAVLSLVGSHLLMNHRVSWICWAFVGIGLTYREHLNRSGVGHPGHPGSRQAPPNQLPTHGSTS